MMIRSVRTVLAITALSATTALYSCKTKDSDIQKDFEAKKSANAAWANVSADVKDGVVTLTGTVADDATRAAAETDVKGIKGVKNVVNNLTVPPPVVEQPMPPMQTQSPLEPGVMDAVKSYPTVKASVKDSVIMLEGSISKADNVKLTQALNSLHPKKIDRSKFTVK